ncbi:MAG TPA: hypothetical protein DGH68_02900, partial [Bacteroidetes bacterium]|nr:hypothetical protein [Bacteroidota bacterium]
MVTLVRIKIKDLAVRSFMDPEIQLAINEGKNELVKIIRQANENYFEETLSTTISATTKPNYSTLALPADFSELRDLRVTTSGLEDLTFQHVSQSDQRFRQALIDGGSYASGAGVMFYDFYGESTMIFAPGADIDIPIQLLYTKTIPDMTYPSSYCTGVPLDHSDFMVTWAICECMRTAQDPRLSDYESKLDFQRESIINSVNTRQRKEP